MIFAKVWDYDLASGEEELIGNIRRHNDISLLKSINPSVTRVEINPIIVLISLFISIAFIIGTYIRYNKKELA